jgi:CHASE1-domain containing sensor protein
VPLLVLALALAVSYAVWERERREIERVLKEDFDSACTTRVNTLRERVQGYEQVLRAVSGLFASSRKVERSDFQTFVRNLKMEVHPGAPGRRLLGARARRRARAPSRQRARRGLPDLCASVPRRAAVYTSAIFFAPPRRPSSARSAPTTRRAVAPRRARAGARHAGVAVSNKIALPGEDAREVQPGFRMVWPVYRNGAPLGTVQERRDNIVGWIFAAFSMEGLLGSILSGDAQQHRPRGVRRQRAAGRGPTTASGVDRVGGESALRLFSAARRVEAGGHTWMVTAQALPNFATPIAISQLQLVTIVGGASSVALALFTWALMRRRLRRLRYREELQIATDRAEAANRAKSALPRGGEP